jgi:hypothetical protein
MVSILLGWWWGGSLLVLLLLLKRVCGAYHSLFLSFQLFCISRYVARLVLCCVQSLLSVDWPFPLLLLLYYYSLPNALAYYSRRHDAPIIHSCCKLPHKTFYFVFFRIFFFFSLTFALKRSSQCRPASSSFALACVMYISLFFLFLFFSLPRVTERERAMMAWRIRFVWAATPSGCLRVISPPSPPPLSYTVHV